MTGISEVFLQGTLRMRVGRERRTVGGGIFCCVHRHPLHVSLDFRYYGMQPQYSIPWMRSVKSVFGDVGMGFLHF